MAAGILPISLYKNRIYFLFGKENKYADTPGWSDFVGGIDKGETAYTTAVREAQEEITGFLGGDKEIKELIGKKPYIIKHNTYQVYVCPLEYNEFLPFYFNNNQRFLQKKLDPKLIEKSKIFEKDEIRWVSIDSLEKMKPEFRPFYKEIVDILISKKSDFLTLLRKWRKHTRTKTKQNKTKNNKGTRKIRN